ncbi:MAG: thiol reductant ABC exporter subunit CydD, partial [bacterium]|nr:thiol reductant ABC exporter subunit CydD [bacterium]
VLAVIVPVAVLLTVLGQDLLSTLIIAVTLPLIPLFMALIGMYTRAQVDRQWRTLAVLSGHFLDLVSGLPTLKIFGRAKTQATAIRAIGDRYRTTTMGVLRVSFLSSLALELIASLSVALVAVSVGLRLAEGQIVYPVALFVLLLAPEAYLPLRLVGQHFHAAAEGLGAAERLFAVLETPLPMDGSGHLPSGAVTIQVSDLKVTYPGRTDPALDRATFIASPGTITAVVGRSGGGKSTLLNALLGFVEPSSGAVKIAIEDFHRSALTDLDIDAWRARVAWVPQRAHLICADLAGSPSIASVVRLGRATASDQDVWDALSVVGLAADVRARPDGLASTLSPDGSGLSVGQLQRLALARALVSRADVVLLDEPTAALDIATETAVVEAIRQEATRGATVIVVAHRPALVDIAHQIIRLDSEPLPSDVAAATPTAALTIRGAGW